jgi:hypothetical protein
MRVTASVSTESCGQETNHVKLVGRKEHVAQKKMRNATSHKAKTGQKTTSAKNREIVPPCSSKVMPVR